VANNNLIFAQYEERLRRRGRSHQTALNFRSAASHYQLWLADKGLETLQIETWQVEEYMEQLNLAASTKRMHLTQLKAAYRYAIARGLLVRNPCAEVELPVVAAPRPRILTSATLREMKQEADADSHLWLMFHLLAYTGMRRDEVRTLHWEAVDFVNGTMDVLGKAQKRRLVPIHPALGEALSEFKGRPAQPVFSLRKSNPVTTPTFYKWLEKLNPDATFHDFRRTVASSLDANGVEEGIIMRIMGWAPRTIFDRHYRNVADERLQRAILKLYADDPLL